MPGLNLGQPGEKLVQTEGVIQRKDMREVVKCKTRSKYFRVPFLPPRPPPDRTKEAGTTLESREHEVRARALARRIILNPNSSRSFECASLASFGCPLLLSLRSSIFRSDLGATKFPRSGWRGRAFFPATDYIFHSAPPPTRPISRAAAAASDPSGWDRPPRSLGPFPPTSILPLSRRRRRLTCISGTT